MTHDPANLTKRESPWAIDPLGGAATQFLNSNDAVRDGRYVAHGPAAGSKRTAPLHPGVGRRANAAIVIGHRAQRGGR